MLFIKFELLNLLKILEKTKERIKLIPTLKKGSRIANNNPPTKMVKLKPIIICQVIINGVRRMKLSTKSKR